LIVTYWIKQYRYQHDGLKHISPLVYEIITFLLNTIASGAGCIQLQGPKSDAIVYMAARASWSRDEIDVLKQFVKRL
jgi:hypothetical protein